MAGQNLTMHEPGPDRIEHRSIRRKSPTSRRPHLRDRPGEEQIWNPELAHAEEHHTPQVSGPSARQGLRHDEAAISAAVIFPLPQLWPRTSPASPASDGRSP